MQVTENWAYLNHAAVGPLPTRTADELKKQIEFKAKTGGGFSLDDSMEAWENARRIYARLLGAPSEMIATPLSTAHAISIALDAIEPYVKKSGNIVLNSMEFTTNSYPYQIFAARHGLKIHVVDAHDGEIFVENFSKVINDDTFIVGLSHVQFSNGYKSDLKEISKIAHDHNAYFFVDGIQAMGTTPVHVRDWELDFYGGSGFKWLLGPYGAAIAYFNQDVFGNLQSIPGAGWWSAKDFKQMSHNYYKPANDARRFQSNIFPNMIALEKSISLLLDVGIEKIQRKIHELHTLLIQAFKDDSRVKFESPLDEKKRGGIVLMRVPNVEQAIQYLMEHKIRVSLRNGAIRVAPHGYNTKEEIQLLIETLKEFLDKNTT